MHGVNTLSILPTCCYFQASLCCLVQKSGVVCCCMSAGGTTRAVPTQRPTCCKTRLAMSTKFIRNTLASLFRNLYNQKGQSICTIVVFGSFEQTESGSVVTVDLVMTRSTSQVVVHRCCVACIGLYQSWTCQTR